MTIMLRVVLILASAATMIMMIQKIRRAKLQIEDAIFWVLVSFMFVLFSLFPPVADFLAHLLGIYATVNFLFLMMIFLLLLRVFSMTIRMSQQETKVKELAQKLALYELEQREKAKEDLCKTDDVGRRENLCKADDAGRGENLCKADGAGRRENLCKADDAGRREKDE